MAMVEIDENQYAELARRAREFDRVDAILKQVVKEPKHAAKLQEVLVEAAPEMISADVRARVENNTRYDELRSEWRDWVAKQEAAQTEAKLVSQWENSRMKAVAAGYAPDGGLKDLEEFMLEKGIGDHEVAMAAFEKLHPQPEPVSSTHSKWGSGTGFNFFDQETQSNDLFKRLMSGDTEGFLADSIPQALKEVRGR